MSLMMTIMACQLRLAFEICKIGTDTMWCIPRHKDWGPWWPKFLLLPKCWKVSPFRSGRRLAWWQAPVLAMKEALQSFQESWYYLFPPPKLCNTPIWCRSTGWPLVWKRRLAFLCSLAAFAKSTSFYSFWCNWRDRRWWKWERARFHAIQGTRPSWTDLQQLVSIAWEWLANQFNFQ